LSCRDAGKPVLCPHLLNSSTTQLLNPSTKMRLRTLLQLTILLVSVFAICWVFFANEQPVLEKNDLLTLKICKVTEEKKLEELIDTSFYLQLYDSSPKSKVMGEIRTLKIYGDTIWVLDSQCNLFAFQLDGRLIGQVNKKGDGPGGTLQIADFEVQGNKIYTLEMLKPYLQVFDQHSFKPLRNQKLSYEYNYSDLCYWEGNWYFHAPTIFSDRALHVYSTDFQFLYQTKPHIVTSKAAIFTAPRPFIKTDEGLSVNLIYNDTIFNFANPNRLIPKLCIDYCAEKRSKSVIKSLNNTPSTPQMSLAFSQYKYLLDFHENSRFYWLKIFTPRKKLITVLLDKSKKTALKVKDMVRKDSRTFSTKFISTHHDYFLKVLDEEEEAEFDKQQAPKKGQMGVVWFVAMKS
jgi:6-bladed beta-propeller